ncbi:hypothetical protein [Streptacidiphilus sp. MAP12-16]|uniref:hypothetical protein n=1 Tax=Streptacidiphilus sp. MAP12-16 TaxID=3156300 RepID=UPI00351831A4
MNDWMRARSGWTIFLIAWGAALSGGSLGEATEWMFQTPHPSLTAHLPWLLGGSMFMALVGTASTLRRRRTRGEAASRG